MLCVVGDLLVVAFVRCLVWFVVCCLLMFVHCCLLRVVYWLLLAVYRSLLCVVVSECCWLCVVRWRCSLIVVCCVLLDVPRC